MESRNYCAYSKSRGNFLSLRIAIAENLNEPGGGQMQRLEGNSQSGLWITPSGEIPTGHPLPPSDLVYLDADCRVVNIVEISSSAAWEPPKAPATSVLALPPRTILATQIQRGDELLLWTSEAETQQPGRKLPFLTRARLNPARTKPDQETFVTHKSGVLGIASPLTTGAQAPKTQTPTARLQSKAREEYSLLMRFRSRIAVSEPRPAAGNPLSILPASPAPAPAAARVAPAPAAPAPAPAARITSNFVRPPFAPAPAVPARVAPAPAFSAPATPARSVSHFVPSLVATVSVVSEPAAPAPAPARVAPAFVPPPVAPASVVPEPVVPAPPVARVAPAPAAPAPIPPARTASAFVPPSVARASVVPEPVAPAPAAPARVKPAPPTPGAGSLLAQDLPEQFESQQLPAAHSATTAETEPELLEDTNPYLVLPERKSSFWGWLVRRLSGPVRAPRFKLPGLVAYFWTGGSPQPHYVGNISTSGMYLLTQERWLPDTVLLMNLQRTTSHDEDDSDSRITVLSRVVRSDDEGVGVQFLTSDFVGPNVRQVLPGKGTDKEAIKEFLYRLKSSTCEG